MKATRNKTEQPEQSPVILSTNQNAVIEMRSRLDLLLSLASVLTTEYYKLPYAREGVDLNHILTGTDQDKHNYLLSLIPDDGVQLPGLKLNKEKASLFLELPAFPEFETARNQLAETNFLEFQAFFKIQDQEAIINPEAWETFVKRQSIVASTPDELELYDKMQTALTAVLSLDALLKTRCNFMLINGVNLAQFSKLVLPDNECRLKINPNYFQALAKTMSINHKPE